MSDRISRRGFLTSVGAGAITGGWIGNHEGKKRARRNRMPPAEATVHIAESTATGAATGGALGGFVHFLATGNHVPNVERTAEDQRRAQAEDNEYFRRQRDDLTR